VSWIVELEKALQLCAQRPSSPQWSVRTPEAEYAGQVESVTLERINKEKFTIFLRICS